MDKENHENETCDCTVGKLFSDFEDMFGRKSPFYKHVTQSRIEFLKAVRSLVDDRIEKLEKKRSETPEKKAEKIVVE